MTVAHEYNKQDARNDIAGVLGVSPDDLAEGVNLSDAGMDSLRTMALVEKWREAGFAHIDFVTLAADPTIDSWLAALFDQAA
ncbi:phosphopantetheine-binding protein [Hoyosella sp. YIM 151337]|uniref:phosphopantetheine-binding protein n=1 Tax=Hoyosella sp. YIM 151337 TaxID=2992742 RepID=UPI002235A6E8|nr:phosphopantetheine-binding protein [Hoyosella sp. YIM 151337]MCW4354186.1 phosphopantetheine-binding protein [Hoyosella sp. YIM 151337]